MTRKDQYPFLGDGLVTPLARLALGCRSGRPGYHEVFEDGAVFRASAQDRLSGRDLLWVHGASIGQDTHPLINVFRSCACEDLGLSLNPVGAVE